MNSAGNGFPKSALVRISAILISLWLCTGCGPKTAETHYAKGLKLYKERKYEKAIRELQASIGLNPGLENAYRKLAACYLESGDGERAVQYFEQISQMNPGLSYPHYALGLVFAERKAYEKALEQCQLACRGEPQFAALYSAFSETAFQADELELSESFLYERLRVNPTDAYSLYGLGNFYRLQMRREEALTRLDAALQVKPDLPEAHFAKMQIFRDAAEYDNALTAADSGLAAARRKKDFDLSAAFLAKKGNIYYSLGEPQPALQYFREGLNISRESGNIPVELEALNGLGVIYRLTQQYPDALQCLREGLKISRERDYSRDEGRTAGNIGDVYLETAQYDSALACYEIALQTAQENKDRLVEANCLGSLASACFYRGDFSNSLIYGEKALEIYRELQDRGGEANELINFGTIYLVAGDYTKAIRFFNRGLSIAREIGEKDKQQIALGNLGSIYLLLGEPEPAREHLEPALEIAREMDNKIGVAINTASLGSVALFSGDTLAALQHFREALPVFTAISDRNNEAITCANIGTIYSQQGNHREALQFIERAVAINREIGNRLGEANSYNDLAAVHLRQKNYPQALEFYQKALASGEELSAVEMVWKAQYGLARVYEQEGRGKEAENHYRQAIQTVEDVRSQLATPEHKSGFFEEKVEIYAGLVGLLYRQYRKEGDLRSLEAAFQYAERSKARALIEMLAESGVDATQGVDSLLLERREEIFRRIGEIQTRLISENLTGKAHKRLREQLRAEEENLQSLSLEIKQQNPAYADLQYPDPLPARSAQRMLRNRDEILLEFSLGRENSYLWAISSEALAMYQLPSEKEIAGKVKRYLAMIGGNSPPAISHTDLGYELWAMLLSPAAALLQGKKNLHVIPDGILHYLPFEALVAEEQESRPVYALEKYAFSYAPSASVLAALRKRGTPGASGEQLELLAFGDPVFDARQSAENPARVSGFPEDSPPEAVQGANLEGEGLVFSRLPYTKAEVEGIAALFPAGQVALYLRENAREEQLKGEDLRRYRHLHFATHGIIDEKNPQRSSIVFTLDDDPTDDGFLQMNEIFRLRLAADLVVLSACNTARGKLVRGEGMIGLSRAFFYAGARSLVASLWPVSDRSTARLMEHFYRNLQQGLPKDEALCQAKREMLQSPHAAWRRPFYWAPFVIMGLGN